MSETLSMAPIWFTDVIGSAAMVVLSFLSVIYALRLVRAKPADVIWTYLLWLTFALAVFAVSRSVGHIAKRLLLLGDMDAIWLQLRPYSGALNTITFMAVASITLFFHRVQKIHAVILDDRRALREASLEVMRLNEELESLVIHRTEELSQSESKYRRVFEGSMDMIFILDGRGGFVDINKAGLSTLGFTSTRELVGRKDLESFFVSPEDYGQLVAEVLQYGFVKDRECRLRSKTGAELFVLLSATGGKDEEGRPIRYEGMAKDITARKHLERQLQQADKLASLGQISTGLAHEINNPLGVVLGYTQLLLRETESGTQIRDDLKTIEKHARNCKTILDDLLKFARSTPTKKSSVDINECLSEVISLLAHQFELEKISLQTVMEPGLPRLVADGEKVKQVFMNLLMNAKQAITNTGNIVVQTKKDRMDSSVEVAITDDGCGIAQEHLHKIFDPFFTTKPVGEGTGLGLSVSYGIIQDHGGRIEVSSEPGKGSTFSVFLPLEEAVVADTGGEMASDRGSL